jgi:hypothetical protein
VNNERDATTNADDVGLPTTAMYRENAADVGIAGGGRRSVGVAGRYREVMSKKPANEFGAGYAMKIECSKYPASRGQLKLQSLGCKIVLQSALCECNIQPLGCIAMNFIREGK